MHAPTASNRWEILWPDGSDVLRATEPAEAEISAAADSLAAWYSEDHNLSMMGNTAVISPAEVIAHLSDQRQHGVRYFLLYCGAELVGDADFRHIGAPVADGAEYAIMIGSRAKQGHGLGGRFGVLLHAFARKVLNLQRVYVAILPGNLPSQRMFTKFGYCIDNGPMARAYAESSTDVTMSLDLSAWELLHGAACQQMTMAPQEHAAHAPTDT